MLVESMTHAEVYRELDRDRDTATTWWRHHLDTLRRPVLKARQLPLIHWADSLPSDSQAPVILANFLSLKHSKEDAIARLMPVQNST